ncbi:MAG: hypothetical protein ABMA15_14495 [Vicinamibacterales bacterium]
MPQASFATTAAFLCVVFGVAALFVWALTRAPRGNGGEGFSISWAVVAVALLAVWLGVPAVVAATGALSDFSGRPPAIGILLTGLFVCTTALAFSSAGSRLVQGVPIAGLIGFQVFRIPVEMILHRLHVEGIVPVQMTYAGYNFDIVSGTLAGIFGVWAFVSRPPTWVILGINIVGSLLLLNIVSIAVLSMPTPMRAFQNGPPNTFVAHLPFVWLPSLLVQAAWFGHLLVFRWLSRASSAVKRA